MNVSFVHFEGVKNGFQQSSIRALCIFFGQKGHRPPRSDRARTPMLVRALVDNCFPLANGGMFSVAFFLVMRSLKLNPQSVMTSFTGSNCSRVPDLKLLHGQILHQSKGLR